MTTTTDTYLFEGRSDLGDLEQRRLHALAALFDPATHRLLTQVGVERGSRCLEVAAGTGSVAAWLADQVGPEGEVYATDIDLTHLGQLPPNVTSAQHDIVEEALPDGAFDVVHTRLLLEHLSGRETALNRMATAVRPGGYVVVEEAEMSPQALELIVRYQPLAGRELGHKALRALAGLLGAVGADMGYASSLPSAVRRAGLELVGGEIHSPLGARRCGPGLRAADVHGLPGTPGRVGPDDPRRDRRVPADDPGPGVAVHPVRHDLGLGAPHGVTPPPPRDYSDKSENCGRFRR